MFSSRIFTYYSFPEFYEAAFFEKYNRDLDFELNLIKRYATKSKPKKILDVGCGFGKHLYLLRNDFDYLEGVDISPSLIRIAKEKYSAKNINYFVSDGIKYISPNRPFGVVISLFSVVQYFKRYSNIFFFFINMKKNLSKNGFFIFNFYLFDREKTYKGKVKVRDKKIRIKEKYEIKKPFVIHTRVFKFEDGKELKEKVKYLFLDVPTVRMLSTKARFKTEEVIEKKQIFFVLRK